MTLAEWSAATVVGGLIGLAIWSLWQDRRPLGMGKTWLETQADRESKAGWEGPYWPLRGEQRDRTRRERFARMAESRRQLRDVKRRKDVSA